jgi:hypothetical protein
MSTQPCRFPALGAAIPLLSACAALLAASAAPSALAQGRETSAREALDLVSAQFGPRAVQWVAEMHATRGMPQPTDWEIVSYDDRFPQLLYRFRSGGGRASDIGPDESRYPVDVPMGYFSPNQIAVDSVAAFTIAEGEARRARVAFDSCEYLLRVREFSTEPLWRLELIDANRRIVGKLYISATSGAVLRTVWIYRDAQRLRPDGLPTIDDSFAPTRGFQTTGVAPAPDLGVPSVPTAMAPPTMAPAPDAGGLSSIPAPPAPGVPGSPAVASGPQPFQPVDRDGRPINSGIPEPPPLNGGATVPPPAPPTASTGTMPDLRTPPAPAPAPAAPSSTAPTSPPIPVPSGGATSTGRIPPPPVPR